MLFRYLDGFFLYGFFLSFDDEDRLPWFDPRVRDTSARDLDWLDALWRRSLVLHKADRNIAKLFSLAVRLPQFLERFPEAQILYMARDPLSVIPSSMSLVIGVLDRAFGFWSLPETRSASAGSTACTRRGSCCCRSSTRTGRAAPSTRAASSSCATTG